MKDSKVLVVNQGYQPVTAITWERAMCLIFASKAEVVTHYEGRTVRSASASHTLPAVIKLTTRGYRRSHHVKFSRENVYTRDKHTCQYCGKKKHAQQLTFDHVIPRALGGRTDWNNIVTACRPCNSDKADKLPSEAGMRPIVEPRMPNISENHAYMFSTTDIPDEWKYWLN